MMVLVGWACGIPRLTTLLPGLTTMKANTALGLLAAGVTLMSLRQPGPERAWTVRSRLAVVAGLFVLALGSATLVEYVCNVRLGIDECLFADPATTSAPYNGRMSPATALSFACLGMAVVLLTSASASSVVAAHWLAVPPAALGALSLTGYAYGVERLYSFGPFVSVALNTAFCLCALAGAVLLTRPKESWLRPLAGSPAAGAVFARLLPWSFLLPFATGFLVLAGVRAGFYEALFGLSLFTVATVGALVWLSWTTTTIARHVENALRESEARFRGTFDQAAVGVAHVALDGRWLRVNGRLCAMLGYTETELLARSFQDITYPDDLQADLDKVQRLLATNAASYDLEKRYVCKDGSLLWINLTVSLLRNQAGAPVNFISVVEDISSRKAAEAEREAILASIADGFLAMDSEWRYSYLNASGERLLQMRKEDLLGKNHWELYPATLGTVLEREYRRTMDERVPVTFENFFAPWERWFELRAYPALTGGITVYFQDITERKQAQQALARSREELERLVEARTAALAASEAQLRDSEATFRLLAEHANDMVSRVGPDGTRLYVSPASIRLFGVPSDDLLGRRLLDRVLPPDRAALEACMRRLLSGSAESESVAYRVAHPQRGEVWIEGTAQAVRDPATGAPDGYVVVSRDITERKRAETVMAEANRLLALGEQVGGVGHWRYEPGSGRLHWSAEIYRIHGLDPHGPQPTVEQAVEAYHPEDRPIVRDAIEKAITERSGYNMVLRLLRPDGDVRHVQARAVVEQGPDGTAKALFGVFVDITEQVRTQAALRAEQRAMEVSNVKLEHLANRLATARDEAERASQAKSRFLAAVSHELRTPLNGILGYTQLLHAEGGLSATQAARVDAMLGAGRHLLDMINRVLNLSEIEAGHVEVRLSSVDPFEIAQACMDVVRPTAAAKGLTFDFTTVGDIPCQMATDPMRLRQVLLNLLGNAVKFTERGGVTLGLRRLEGNMLRMEVADTGPGIPAEQRHRLFHDFERIDTVAGAVEGSGLGLALSARLATLLGGHVGQADALGGGSVFWLDLPLAPPRETGLPTASPAEDAAHGATAVSAAPLRVLVADDVHMNRDIAGAFLRSAGHEVTCVNGGAEAVAVAETSDFDVILMDVRMPGVDGLEATRRIRALAGPRGRVPVVALTAQAFAEQVAECRKAGMDNHLTKPFTPDALLGMVARAAAARTRGQLACVDGP